LCLLYRYRDIPVPDRQESATATLTRLAVLVVEGTTQPTNQKKMNILIDLFDHSGNSAKPYREAGWHVIQIDIKHGVDILTWDYKKEITRAVNDNWSYSTPPKIGLLSAVPCTDYALSGAKHFAEKDADGRTAKSDLLVDKVYEIKMFVQDHWSLSFWKIENPRSRIHTRHKWLGKITHKFNPCDYAGYTNPTADQLELLSGLSNIDMLKAKKEDLQTVIDIGAYNKDTWLWGKFSIPIKNHIPSVWKENPGWRLYGGKSERTKELRSVDPIGFCKAFFEANH